MPLDPDKLLASLQARSSELGKPARCLVAFSGGRDSTVLLALLADVAKKLGTSLQAVHVNHQLQREAQNWQAHCATVATALGVPFHALTVEVSGDAGPEGNARQARYAVLADLLGEGDWLLTGHHQDDQAETLLLNLMRGSGVSGMRGIAACRPLGRGFLLRPLLSCSPVDIDAFGRQRKLSWIEDPSNLDTRFDRNFLRGKVLPLLTRRWPAAGRQLATSAMLAAESALLNNELAAMDLERCGSAERLSVSGLTSLSAARAANLLRYACAALALPRPPRRQGVAILQNLLPARVDAQPLVSWPGAEARRYQDWLYLMPALAAETAAPQAALQPGATLALGTGMGELDLVRQPTGGLAPQIAEAGLTVRFRGGGEVLRPLGRGTAKTVKCLLQEASVVPWMRQRLPLLYHADELVAVADLWLAEESCASDGFRVVWHNKPAIL